MKIWYRSGDKLPANKQQVLVKEGDYMELAFYDEPKNCFRLKNGTTRNSKDKFLWIPMEQGGL